MEVHLCGVTKVIYLLCPAVAVLHAAWSRSSPVAWRLILECTHCALLWLHCTLYDRGQSKHWCPAPGTGLQACPDILVMDAVGCPWRQDAVKQIWESECKVGVRYHFRDWCCSLHVTTKCCDSNARIWVQNESVLAFPSILGKVPGHRSWKPDAVKDPHVSKCRARLEIIVPKHFLCWMLFASHEDQMFRTINVEVHKDSTILRFDPRNPCCAWSVMLPWRLKNLFACLCHDAHRNPWLVLSCVFLCASLSWSTFHEHEIRGSAKNVYEQIEEISTAKSIYNRNVAAISRAK